MRIRSRRFWLNKLSDLFVISNANRIAMEKNLFSYITSSPVYCFQLLSVEPGMHDPSWQNFLEGSMNEKFWWFVKRVLRIASIFQRFKSSIQLQSSNMKLFRRVITTLQMRNSAHCHAVCTVLNASVSPDRASWTCPLLPSVDGTWVVA